MKILDKMITEKSLNTKGEARRHAIKNLKIADEHAINFAKWLTDRDNLKEILYEQTWEQILNQYYKETDI